MKRWLLAVLVVSVILSLVGTLAVNVPAAPLARAAEPLEGHFGLPAGAIDHLEPTLAYTALSMRIEFVTCTPLVTFPDAEGEEGRQIIGGIAELPEISEDGKIYTFTLKPGVKFGDGTPITGEDIKATFERMFNPNLASPGAGFFTEIVGAEEFAAGEADTIEGIKVDGDKIAFELTQPVGSFMSRLTMPFVCPVPKGTPAEPMENGELLNTGPYFVESYEPNRSLVLARNPHYNADVMGQRGKLDRIVIDIGIDPAQAGLMARANQLDLYLDRMAPADAAQALEDPALEGRVFRNPQAAIVYLWMNNDVPPFDSVKVRQAVNHAINRNALLRVWGGPSQGMPTDQVLPPTMPGWQDVDIYPMAGDVEKAKELLAESGVELPIQTTLRTINDQPGFAELAQAVQQQLKEVGIEIDVQLSIDSVNIGIIQTRASKVPMGINAWYQDYPDPDNFLNTLLDGTRITETNNQNTANFNNPEINAELAELAQLTGPDRYTRYHQLDEKIIREHAPWAPLLNPSQVHIISDRVVNYVYHPVYGADLAVISIKE